MIDAIHTASSARAAGAGPAPNALTVLVPVDADTAGGPTIRRLAPFLIGHRLVVVGTWRSIGQAAGIARAAMPAAMVNVGVARMNEEHESAAQRAAENAAAVARECGIDVHARTLLLRGGWTPGIAALAEDEQAHAVLLAHPSRALSRRLRQVEPTPLVLVVA